ncbi:MAG: ferredoxin--NADP(+) reductase [bacterium]|nr:ferredoxin--NADP(+) reductase [bacterium]
MNLQLIEKVVPADGEVYKPSDPFLAPVVENRRLTPEDSEDVRHIVLDISRSGMRYVEGQSIGIVPPGVDEKGKRHRPRLYSIASARCGEIGCDIDNKATTVTLCVKRVVYQDESGQEVRGLASNHLCDAQPGDDLQMTGPIGRKFLLPADDSNHLIMIAVGTGIAPFRAFVQYIYGDHGSWGGKVKLFYGAKTGLETLYMNEQSNDIGQYYTQETFEAIRALSREETTESGKRVYVQDKIARQKDELWTLIKEGHFCLYICGLKGMEEGVDQVLSGWASAEGLDWEEMKKGFKDNGRWNVEVY